MRTARRLSAMLAFATILLLGGAANAAHAATVGPADMTATVGPADMTTTVGPADMTTTVGPADMTTTVGPADMAAGVTAPVETLVSCYDGSVAISLPGDGWSGEYTTSSRCNDINLRIDSGGGLYVAVCWAKYGTCQANWTWVPEDVGYRVIATDVLDGTRFYFNTCCSGGTRSGRVAY